MTDKRLAESPLLYIHQPMLKPPKAAMQSNYRTPNHSTELLMHEETEEKALSNQDVNDNETNPHMDDKKELHHMIDTQEGVKFNDMTLKEKVSYLVSVPEHMPSIKCIVKTAERTYEGVITEYKENLVYIRIGRHASSISVQLDEIESIRLLGF